LFPACEVTIWQLVGPAPRRPGSARTRHRSKIGGKGTRGGDLLTARPQGSQTEHQDARRESVPCVPPLGQAGMNPRREKITTQHEARKGGPGRRRVTCTGA
jgi:hypothetical protein